MTTKITLGIAVLFLLIVGAEQNQTIVAQRTAIRTMTTNPACMVAVQPTKQVVEKPQIPYNPPLGTRTI